MHFFGECMVVVCLQFYKDVCLLGYLFFCFGAVSSPHRSVVVVFSGETYLDNTRMVRNDMQRLLDYIVPQEELYCTARGILLTRRWFLCYYIEKYLRMVFMAYVNNLSKEEQKRLAREKVEKALMKINSDVFSIFDTDTLPPFLSFMAKFHYFDVNNLVLIYKQRPTATFIASYNTWERISLNHWHDPSRPVFLSSQKGQGIGILAPYVLKKKLSDATDLRSAAVSTRVVPYFEYHIVFVFDREQVNGIPAPVASWDLSKDKIDAEAAFHAFKAIAPFHIVFSADENFKGHYVFEDGKPDENRPDVLVLNGKCRHDCYALCNFIVRIFVSKSMPKLQAKYSPDEFEKFTECVSFVIANYFGLPVDSYTFFFAKTWGRSSQNMLELLYIVRHYAHLLIENLEAEMIDYKKQFNMPEDTFSFDDDFSEFENLSIFDF